MEINNHLFVTDLDGTLLHFDETLSDWSRDTLTSMLNKGLHFTVASARSHVSIRQVLGNLPLQLPVIEINGAFVTELHTGKHIIINEIDKHALPELYSLIIQFQCAPFLSTYNGQQDCLYHPDIINDGIRFYYDNRVENKDPRLRKTIRPDESFKDDVVAMTVINRVEILREIQDVILNRFNNIQTHLFENPYSPSWWWLTIHDKKACKSIAINEMIEAYDFDADELTVFGDNYNDYEMFKIAPNAVAVENAAEDLKTLATEVIGTNEQDSVVKYISSKLRC